MSNRVDIKVSEYTQADVIRITAVSAKTLQNWTDPNRGILRLSQDSVGKGRRRLYSPLDIMAVLLIAQLASLGIAPNLVSQLFYEEKSLMSDWFQLAVEDTDREHVCRIFFDANGLFARLISTKEENKVFAYEAEDLLDKCFAFVQASLTGIAAFVLQGISEIRFEETPDQERSAKDKAIFAMRDELREMKKKDRQA